MRYYESFYSYISNNFSPETSLLLKKWVKSNKELIDLSLRIRFLFKCKRSNIVPKHFNLNRLTDFTFYYDNTKRRWKKYTNMFTNRLLNLEIKDNIRKRYHTISTIYCHTRKIEERLPYHMCEKFFYTQNLSLNKLYFRERNRLTSKFNRLIYNKNLQKQKENISNIKYYYSTHNGVFRYTFNKPYGVDSSHLIELEPENFNYKGVSCLEPKEKWFTNTSGKNIPKEVIGLLQLGENFCLPSSNTDRDTVECIKSFENSLNRIRSNNRNTLRNTLFPLIKNIKNDNKSSLDLDILASVSSTKKFIVNNPDVIFTKADKGNTTVALDRMDYIKKMEINLSDNNTYISVQRNPINKIIEELKRTLKRWLQNDYISSYTHSQLNASNAILPRAYGLPKIHKTGHPLRIIVSSIGSPLHNFATFLKTILQTSFPISCNNFRNSVEIVKKLSNFQIPDDHDLVSLDVVSLFTNVPIDMVMEVLDNRWNLIESHTKIPKKEFLNAVKFTLNSTYFIFNGKTYKQTFGAPMGSPLSPIIADLALQNLESHSLKNLSFIPLFYIRYVDDIAMAVPRMSLNELLHNFNTFHPRLKFTLENGGTSLNFLEITMINSDGNLIFDWYHKPTYSGRLLNFHSKHPMTQKRGIITSSIDKILLLSNPKFHQKNFLFLINNLLMNDYPLETIFCSIRKRLSVKFQQLNHGTSQSDTKDNYFVIPYIDHISSKFIQYFKNIPTLKLTFFGINKLNKFIKVHKDPLPFLSRSNVVYKINCLDCDASYVGQTRRLLKQRIEEHRNHIRRDTTQTSVITDHRLKFSHEFDWENVEILDEEVYFNRRLISEMIYIKKQHKGLNLQKDTELLDPIYSNIIGGPSGSSA